MFVSENESKTWMLHLCSVDVLQHTKEMLTKQVAIP